MTKNGAVHVFRSLLMGLQTHGQHDTTQAILVSLALNVYEEMVSYSKLALKEFLSSSDVEVFFRICKT